MDGVLLINKEKGYSSAEYLDKLKLVLEEKSVGHTGTLDPIATGVMVVLLGKCTKLSSHITSLTKEYVATVKIGVKTDTLDTTGNILEEKECVLDKEKLYNVVNSFKKSYDQEVPLYSSVRVNGRHLYEYARENIKVELPKRNVTIYDIELIEVSESYFKFRCVVSKGTYIRSLIRDICENAGIIGTMSDLVRTKQGKFDVSSSFTYNDILKHNYKFLPLEEVFDFERVEITDENKKYVYNGNVIKRTSDKEYFFFYEGNDLKVIYGVYDKDNSKIKPILFV